MAYRNKPGSVGLGGRGLRCAPTQVSIQRRARDWYTDKPEPVACAGDDRSGAAREADINSGPNEGCVF
jgi:hypothetical protein